MKFILNDLYLNDIINRGMVIVETPKKYRVVVTIWLERSKQRTYGEISKVFKHHSDPVREIVYTNEELDVKTRIEAVEFALISFHQELTAKAKEKNFVRDYVLDLGWEAKPDPNQIEEAEHNYKALCGNVSKYNIQKINQENVRKLIDREK